MAQQLSAVIYGYNNNPINSGNAAYPYQTMGFPTQGFLIRPAESGTVFNGVTMVSAIQLLPTGLNQPSVNYYSPTAVATLITNSNA